MPKTKIQCDEIRKKMRKKILDSALIYFARSGYSGTKISDLAHFIGIGQGTLYSYFSSKEELFKVILGNTVISNEENMLKLQNAPVSASKKITILSNQMLEAIKMDTPVAYMFVLNMQYSMENDFNNPFTKAYEERPNQILAEIIVEGQKEKTVVQGNPNDLADLYWSMVHMIALKKVFNNKHETFQTKWLTRLLLSDVAVINGV
ncbi:TetR/AcrR family transcriptional regulator [Clostridium estertheticum]|nr:TetR/AcrR family transcriptional regulator [Clostridium estertheticum]